MSDERRPSFARDFPRLPALDALVDAFARGNYARVREDAPKLQASSDDGAVRKAAGLLVERTRPDPLAVGLLAIAGALLAVLTVYWIVHGKAPPGSAPTAVPTAPPVEHVH